MYMMYMYKYLPQMLGIIDKLNDLNEKLDKFASKYLDNVGVGTIIFGALIAVAVFGIRELNKND